MTKYAITHLKTREILDNRGMPTVRVEVTADNHYWARADVPCGSSTGSYEAFELRDGDHRYRGKGVQKAIKNIQEIIWPQIKGMDVTRQREIDRLMLELDGTDNKSKLGANAILGVSMAVAKAASCACGLPLYRYLNANAYILPVFQACMINGGLHAGNDLEFQEFCAMPVGAETVVESIRMIAEINLALKDLLGEKFGRGAINTGEDGGFAPPITSAAEAMQVLSEAVDAAGYTKDIVYGLDVAATHFYNTETGKYHLEGTQKDRDQMIGFLKNLVEAFPAIVSLEDPLYEDDFEGHKIITDTLSETLIIGDDTFTTNIDRLRKGKAAGAANAVLWKVNQIGSITEAFDAAHYAVQNGYSVVVSERSGETEDDILSDLSVALNAGAFKTGGLRGSDRGSNYNRFIEIEEELGSTAVYAGRNYRGLI